VPLTQAHQIPLARPADKIIAVKPRLPRIDLMDAEATQIEHPAPEFVPVHVMFPIRITYNALSKRMQQ
jgi:hypothetical protein